MLLPPSVHKTHVATCASGSLVERVGCVSCEVWLGPQPNESRQPRTQVRAEKLSVSKFPATRDPDQNSPVPSATRQSAKLAKGVNRVSGSDTTRRIMSRAFSMSTASQCVIGRSWRSSKHTASSDQEQKLPHQHTGILTDTSCIGRGK